MNISSKIYQILIVILISSLTLGYFYFKSENNALKEKNIILLEKYIKLDKESAESLKKEINLNQKKMDSIDQLLISLRKKNSILKEKISQHEKIRYFDDVNADNADSIIARSRYRHSNKVNNIK